MTTMVKGIQMVNLQKQYLRFKKEIDAAVLACMSSTQFINGPEVKKFAAALEDYLGVRHVIPCANGTDALQIALMALDLQPGDEIIVPAFTYVATAEVIALLGLQPVMIDVDPLTFNATPERIEAAITPKTKAIVPVHLFGQSADMEPIMKIARKHQLAVVEDNAQAIGADYTFSDGTSQKTGTIGDIGCTSFYPSKNLGCYGDGGAIMCNDDELANKLRMIANHGQNKRYYHATIGCNSRLDSMQAAVLNIKLRHLDQFSGARQKVAEFYDQAFKTTELLEIPGRQDNSSHVFHQYTLKVKGGHRDALAAFLSEREIPSMIYYPVPLYQQEAFSAYWKSEATLPVTETLCDEVLSLPIHTEMSSDELTYITDSVKAYFAATEY